MFYKVARWLLGSCYVAVCYAYSVAKIYCGCWMVARTFWLITRVLLGGF